MNQTNHLAYLSELVIFHALPISTILMRFSQALPEMDIKATNDVMLFHFRTNSFCFRFGKAYTIIDRTHQPNHSFLLH